MFSSLQRFRLTLINLSKSIPKGFIPVKQKVNFRLTELSGQPNQNKKQGNLCNCMLQYEFCRMKTLQRFQQERHQGFCGELQLILLLVSLCVGAGNRNLGSLLLSSKYQGFMCKKYKMPRQDPATPFLSIQEKRKYAPQIVHKDTHGLSRVSQKLKTRSSISW